MFSTVPTLIAALDNTLLIPIVAVAGIATYFAAGHFRGQRRAVKVEAVAKRLGFAFRCEGTPEDKQSMASSCLGIGIYNHVQNVIESLTTDDLKMKALDYSYSFKTGNYLETATQTVGHIQSPRLRLPAFLLRPASRLAKFGQLLGYSDINFAEAPKFSSMYLLRGENETALRRLFTPALIQHCERLHGISIGGAGDAFVVYRDRQCAKPEDAQKFFAEAKAIALLFVEASSESPPPAQ